MQERASHVELPLCCHQHRVSMRALDLFSIAECRFKRFRLFYDLSLPKGKFPILIFAPGIQKRHQLSAGLDGNILHSVILV
jgi:hypothetical protein